MDFGEFYNKHKTAIIIIIIIILAYILYRWFWKKPSVTKDVTIVTSPTPLTTRQI